MLNYEIGNFRVGDATIHYRVVGSGEPVLVLHNFGANGETWTPFLEPLATNRRLIVSDLRGHGRSNNPGGEWTHARAAEDMVELMASLGYPRFDGIGASSGAMTLLTIAVRKPGLLGAMVLVGGATHLPAAARSFLSSSIENPNLASSRNYHHTDEQFDALRRTFAGFANKPDDLAFTPHHLATITARTLVMQGDRDPLFPPEMALGMYRDIPKASLCILPGAGHVPHVEGRGAQVIDIARAFLERHADRPVR